MPIHVRISLEEFGHNGSFKMALVTDENATAGVDDIPEEDWIEVPVSTETIVMDAQTVPVVEIRAFLQTTDAWYQYAELAKMEAIILQRICPYCSEPIVLHGVNVATKLKLWACGCIDEAE